MGWPPVRLAKPFSKGQYKVFPNSSKNNYNFCNFPSDLSFTFNMCLLVSCGITFATFSSFIKTIVPYLQSFTLIFLVLMGVKVMIMRVYSRHP